MTRAARELVLGLPRPRIMGADGWRGILHGELGPYLERIANEGEHRPRDAVEGDATWKQVIPYLVLRDQGRIFLMRRTRAGGDARLHERWTIGIGGHLNPGDEGVPGGLRREVGEELEVDWDPELRLVGLLNDDTDPVGAVHLGVVYTAEADGRRVAVRETHKLQGAFAEPAEVLRVHDKLETWSSLVFDFLTGRSPGHPVTAGPPP